MTAAYPLVLAQQLIGGITGTSFTKEAIADLLNLYIDYITVIKLNYDIGNYKGCFIGQAGDIICQDFDRTDGYFQNRFDKGDKSLGSSLRIHDLLKEGVVEDTDTADARTGIEKELTMLRFPAMKFSFERRI